MIGTTFLFTHDPVWYQHCVAPTALGFDWKAYPRFRCAAPGANLMTRLTALRLWMQEAEWTRSTDRSTDSAPCSAPCGA